MKHLIKKLYFVLSLIIGIAILYFVFLKFGGIQKPIAIAKDIGLLGILAFVLLFLIVPIAPAIAWYKIMKAEGLPVSLSTTLKANLMGVPINFFTPSMFLGSEPFKTYYIAKVHNVPKRKILATIIVNKFQEIGALLVTMLIAAAIIILRLDIPKKQTIFIISALFCMILVFTIAIYAFVGKYTPITKFVNILAYIVSESRIAKLRKIARDTEKIIHKHFTNKEIRPAMLKAQLITFLSPIAIWARPLLFFLFLNKAILPFSHSSAIYLTINIMNLLPLTPGSLGFFEGGILGTFALLGLALEQANAFSILTRVADMAIISIGIWLIIHYGLRAIASRTVKKADA